VANISIRWLGEILHRYKVRLRRTKTWKESTDPLFARKYRAIRRLYRQRPVGGRRLCIDEFGPLHLVPRHGHCRKGPGQHVQRIPANYERSKDLRHFLAYYDLETDRLYGRFTRRKTGKVFLSFLKWVRSRYPRTQTLHLVMDNYGTHLKNFAMKPSDYHNHEEQQAAIESYLIWRNHARDLSITAWNEYREETAQAA
jgi:hypothetical protein